MKSVPLIVGIHVYL